MNITINSRTCEASTGDRLLDIASANHAHIGYFCGGNGICQTCYVTVLEGAELLSPLTETEKAMLSDRLIGEGTRMTCLATIEKPGTIRILSAVEEVKQMSETAPYLLPAYSAKMGWEALVKFPETIALQIQRTFTGHFNLLQIFSDVIQGIGDTLQLALGGHVSATAESEARSCCQEQTGGYLLSGKGPGAMHNGCCLNGNGASHHEPARHGALHHHHDCGVPA